MLSLHSFIKKLKSSIKSNELHFWVIGNESADTDSIISSIIYAYFLSVHHGYLHIPLINCNRDDLLLRNEIIFLFKEAKIATANLIFIDDICIDDISSTMDKNITLVDHNTLSSSQRFLTQAVGHIIDHHHDEKSCEPETKIIQPTGSCATLIANEIYTTIPKIIDKTVARLLLSPILLDTVNLSKETGRTTEMDITMARRLLQDARVDQQNFYTILLHSKNNAINLKPLELLNLDYKQWNKHKNNYGISSLPISIEDFIKKDNSFADIVEGFAKTKGVNLFIMMHAFSRTNFERELIVWADQLLFSQLFTWLNNNAVQLSYHSLHSSDNGLFLLKQDNSLLSRKHMQPLIDAFFNQ